MQRLVSCAVLGATLYCLVPIVHAGEHDHHAHAAPAAADALSEGTVKRIDKASARVTLAHGPIANLAMPGMTMSFKVKDAKALDKLKEGDKVRFRAEDVGGTLVVVRIEAAK